MFYGHWVGDGRPEVVEERCLVLAVVNHACGCWQLLFKYNWLSHSNIKCKIALQWVLPILVSLKNQSLWHRPSRLSFAATHHRILSPPHNSASCRGASHRAVSVSHSRHTLIVPRIALTLCRTRTASHRAHINHIARHGMASHRNRWTGPGRQRSPVPWSQ